VSSGITDDVMPVSAELSRRLAEALRGVSSLRLSEYRTSTLLRHLKARMRRLELASPEDYVERLVADREECVALVHDLLESTTVFFRDPEAYAGLARTLPHLLLAAPVPHIWVPACAAGEDVYSIAMLVAEAQLGSEIPADFFVLGTDIDLDLLLEAQRGGFGSISAALVPAHLREAYLEFDDGECRVSRSLMSFCSFALHDVLTSPAIQAFDLVDCRNLLGSLQLHAQRRAVEQFAAALRPGGLLLVGRNDVMNAHHDLFERSALANGLFVRRELLPSMSQADTLPYTSYREALEVSATLGAVLDEHGHLLEVNPTLLTFLGSQLDWSGRNAEALLAAGEWTRLLRALGQSARAEMDLHLLIGDHAAPARVSLSRWQTAQGPRLIVEWRLEPEPGDPRPPGDFLHLVRTGLRIMGEGVIATDALGSIDLINPAAERLTGWSQAEALGLGHDSVLKFVSQGQAVAASPVWRCLRREGETLIREERQLLGRDGRRLRVRLTCARLVEDGVVLGALLLLQDITEQSLLVAELAYRSAHDSLTGLYNRGEFERRLSAALALAKSGEATHWLALIDIDQFKVINDTLGHYAGDELLRRLAPVLRSQLRSDDAVARLGGDEFGVLIRAGDATEARRIIDLLLDAVRGYRFAWDERSYSVTVSVGVAEVSAQSEDMARVFANADAACFAAKDAGRDRSRWVLHGDADIRQRHAEMSMVGRIGKALDEQQFLLFYEDVIPASGSTQVHYRELLVRMLDDDGTLVQPAAFIAAAERYYLMTALDRWVVDHACAGIARLPADGVIYAINVSGMSLSDDQFLAFVIGCIERYGVAPERICFEITETAAISHLSEAMSFINRLADLGCRFALDDFGVGMASFSYLKTLPVHFVKIDGSFVRAMHSSAVDRSMVEAINRLGHDMGLRTIAEHVEDAQTLCALGALGVDWVQGKAIAPGRPFNELLG